MSDMFFTEEKNEEKLKSALDALTSSLVEAETEGILARAREIELVQKRRDQAISILGMIHDSGTIFIRGIGGIGGMDFQKVYAALPKLFKAVGSDTWSPNLVAVIKQCVEDTSKDYPQYLKNYVRAFLVATPQ